MSRDHLPALQLRLALRHRDIILALTLYGLAKGKAEALNCLLVHQHLNVWLRRPALAYIIAASARADIW